MEAEIPINMFRQFAFCPRIVFFRELKHISPIYPLWVEQGKEKHEKRNVTLKKKLPKILKYLNGKLDLDVPVRSNFGFFGVLDGLIRTQDELIPIEFKSSTSKPGKSALLQLGAYSVCLEEMEGKEIKRSFLLYGDRVKVWEIHLSNDIREMVRETYQNINEVMNTPLLPYVSTSPSKCIQCEYLNYCNDRNI